jgi:hypothetical protein
MHDKIESGSYLVFSPIIANHFMIFFCREVGELYSTKTEPDVSLLANDQKVCGILKPAARRHQSACKLCKEMSLSYFLTSIHAE